MKRLRHGWQGMAQGILLAAVLFAGCGKPAEESPNIANNFSTAHAVTDGAGRTVKLVAQAQRIVSLSPAATDILVAEGAHAQIAGATRFCNIPVEDEKRVVRIGGMMDPDYERIVSLKPDVVIIPWLADKTLQEKLAALGLPVWVLHPEGLPGVIDDIRMIGKAAGHETEGEAKAKGIENIRAVAQSRWSDVPTEKRPRVLLYMDSVCPAPGSYVDDLLTAAGGRNVLPRGNRAWVEVALENAAQLAPDIVIRIPSGGEPADTTGGMFPGGSTRMVTLTDTAAFYHPGPDLGRALWSLAKAIDPTRFPEDAPPAQRP